MSPDLPHHSFVDEHSQQAGVTRLQRKYRIRIVLFLVAAVLLLVGANAVYKGVNTLHALQLIESERDQWQRTADIITAMQLQQGDMAADVGSGAGYFALRLSPHVGASGRVLAVDIDKLPLVFLWIRAFLQRERNVHVLVGVADDPRLPVGQLNAVLVANTYHEFTNPSRMLDHLRRSLRAGGRLVVVDRSRTDEEVGNQKSRHEVLPQLVDEQLRRNGFEILARDDQFIVRANSENWWLIVSRKAPDSQAHPSAHQ